MLKKIILPTPLMVICFLVFIIGGIPGKSNADVVIVGNISIAVDSIKTSRLRDIFTGQIINWDDGSGIILVTLSNNPVHTEFIKKYTKKTTMQYKLWWRRKVFCGEGLMPVSLSSESKLLKYVAETRGAIGYMSSVPENVDIKIITVAE